MTARTTRRPQPLDDTYTALCRRKAGREAIFAELQSLAAEYGATIRRRTPCDPFELPCTIVLGPYGMHVVLDGRSGAGAFIGHWHIDAYPSCARYPEGFCRYAGSVHPSRHKATTVCDYFDAFKLALRGGLSLLTAEMQKVA